MDSCQNSLRPLVACSFLKTTNSGTFQDFISHGRIVTLNHSREEIGPSRPKRIATSIVYKSLPSTMQGELEKVSTIKIK
jgi:hypothetical protein